MRIIISILILMFVSCKQEVNLDSKTEHKKSNELVIYNWEDYTPLSVVKQFEKETGIKVKIKSFQTIDEQISRLQSNPSMCDLLVVDTHEAHKSFLTLKLIEELDQNLFVNDHVYHHLYEDFKSLGVPYCFGLLGLAVDKRYVDLKFDNYSFLLNPKFKDKISLLNEPVDLYDLCLNATEHGVNNISEKSHSKVIEFTNKLKQQRPVYQDVLSGLDALDAGKVWIAMAYSGDALLYKEENENIEFILPSERPLVFADILSVSANAPNRENAYLFLKYINSPKIAAEIAMEYMYAPGILGAESFMDKESLNNPLINISQDLLSECEWKLDNDLSNKKINKVYQLLNGSNGAE